MADHTSDDHDDASCDVSPSSPSNDDRMSAEDLAKAVAEHKPQLEKKS